MTAFVARRDASNGNYFIFADNFQIGVLVNLSEEGYIFSSRDEELQDWVNGNFEPDLPFRDILAKIRKTYEYFMKNIQEEHWAELEAENAWLRKA